MKIKQVKNTDSLVLFQDDVPQGYRFTTLRAPIIKIAPAVKAFIWVYISLILSYFYGNEMFLRCVSEVNLDYIGDIA